MITYFIISLCVLAAGIIGSLVNMGLAVTGKASVSTFFIHFLCGIAYILGGLGSLITGIIALVQYIKA